MSDKLFAFFGTSMGSASELEYHLVLAHDLKILANQPYESLAQRGTEVKRMLTSSIQKLNADR